MRSRLTFLACAVTLAPAAWAAAPAHAETTVAGGCVVASDPPSSDSDATWSVRVCDLPDFDQVRVAANGVGAPTPVTVAGLPGNGGCHCVLATVADLYARAQESLTGAGTFATFDWNGRGALAAPADPDTGAYDTTTYSADEVAAYQGTTTLLKGLGDLADVSYGQDDAHKDCGTSYSAIYTKLPKLATTFGESADDYLFAESGISTSSPADMARALAGGAGVAFAYGYYTDAITGVDGAADTATVRAGGHANALVGISRNGDTYTFESSDPAVVSEAGETTDDVRQSAFARTTWSVTQRSLKFDGGPAAPVYRFEETSRYLENWVQFGSTNLLSRLKDRAKLRLTRLIPSLKLPPRPELKPGPVDYRFPGPVIDATFDVTTRRVLALVTLRGGPALFAADALTGKVRRLQSALPAGTDRVTALPSGSLAVLGRSTVRTLRRDGRTTASATVAGGAADVAFDGASGGLLVLRGDGRRLLRYSATLKLAGSRKVALPAGAGPASSTARLTVAADGRTRVSRAPVGASKAAQTFATPSGARLVVGGGKAKLLSAAGAPVPRRSFALAPGSTVLELSAGTVTRRPPAGATADDLIDRPVPGLDGASAAPTSGGPAVGELP